MKIINVVNAKGGCGKSTIAMNVAAGLSARGHRTLLIDMDPQAQITQWVNAGDGLSTDGTLTAVMDGQQSIEEVIQPTVFPNLSFVASSEGLEHLGRAITDREDYMLLLARHLAGLSEAYDFIVIDSPNQISPIMENAIWPADIFIVPFESTKAVRSYANVYQLITRLRPREEIRMLHVVSNLTRLLGLRRRVCGLMDQQGIVRANAEIRTCGWLAQVDEHGGSIFHWRPNSKGAADLNALIDEVLVTLGLKQQGGDVPPDAVAPVRLLSADTAPLVLDALPNQSINHDQTT